MSAVVETWDTWALSGKQDQTVTGIGTSKLYLLSLTQLPVLAIGVYVFITIRITTTSSLRFSGLK